MLFDKFAEFADAQSVAQAAGTYNSTNQVDVTNLRDIGNGTEIYLVCTVDTAIVTGGVAGTLQFGLVSDDTAAISTVTRSVHLISPAFVTDDDPLIPAGTMLFQWALPTQNDFVSRSVAGVPVTTGPGAPYERFIGVQFTVGTTAITAGAVSIYLTASKRAWKPYADAVN